MKYFFITLFFSFSLLSCASSSQTEDEKENREQDRSPQVFEYQTHRR